MMWRRAAAEAVGTGFLVAAVIGSGIAAQRLSPGQPGLQLLENSVATGAALVALIVALQPVSAAFNPVVTLLERAFGAVSAGQAAALIAAQLAGGSCGAVAANLMFGLPPVTIATQPRSGPGLWLGETIATLGLVLVICGATRAGRGQQVGYLVGAYITAAYWFTSSTSFANPAVTVARTLSDTFAGITPTSAPMFLLAQLAGTALGYVLIRALYPHPAQVAAQLAASATPIWKAIHDRQAQRALRLRPQRRPIPDGRRLPHPLCRPPDRGPLRRLRTRRPDQPGRRPSHGRRRHRHHRRTTQNPHHRRRPNLRRRHPMGCGDTCPYYPGKRYEDWVLDDPAGQDLATVRAVRNQIRGRVVALLDDLLPNRCPANTDPR
jgi:glycerol uptake facilitator-like aquaporin